MITEQATGRFSVRVQAVRAEAEGVVSLRLAPVDGGPLPEWHAGAHVDLHLPSGLIRQYSLCGDEEDRNSYRIAVLKEPEGRGGSREVHESIRAGDLVTISGPRNHFKLEPAGSYAFIAGGIGITPILAMARAAARQGRPWHLSYGGRCAASMAFVDELTELPGGTLTCVPQDEQGLLDIPAIVQETPADAAIYCCGPTGLIDAVVGHATALRPELPVRFERFSPVTIDASGDEALEVRLARSGKTLVVPPRISILAAVREAGVEIESSCEEGTCGTCETAVLEGIPEHRDSILTAAEREANDVMMICVSRCRSSRLVLDL
jgi:ferredoxin-NADP reductase